MKGRTPRWSLLHTGLLFVLSAVVMQAASIASLLWVLGRADEHLTAQCRARSILTSVDELRHAGVDTSALCALYRANRDAGTLKKYKQAQKKIWAALDELESLVDDDRTESHLLQLMNEKLMCAEMVQQNILHDPREVGVDQFMKGVPTHKVVEQFTSGPNRPLRRIAEIENERLQKLNAGNQPLQRSIAFALLASTICTLATITLLGLTIWRRIRERLRHVMSNALRFSATKPVGPTLPGNDEIAELDRALAKAQAQLREDEQYRQNLLGLVGHELRSPLTAIDVSLTVLLASFHKADAKTKELAHHAEDRIKNIISIITSLIDLEKLEFRADKPPKQQTTLREVVEDALCTLDMQDALTDREVRITARDLNVDCETELAKRLVINLLRMCDRKGKSGSVIDIGNDGREHTLLSINYRGEPIEANSIHSFSKLMQCNIERSAEALDLMLCSALATALGWGLEFHETTINVRKGSQLADTLQIFVSQCEPNRPRFKPNIGAKCLILLMVPAAYCIIFASMFTAFLHELDVQITQEQKSWQVIAAASALTDTVVEAAMCSFLFNATGDSYFARQWTEDKAQLGKKISNLEEVARANSINIAYVGKSIYEILSVHEELFSLPPHTSLDGWLKNADLQVKLSRGVRGFGGPLSRATAAEKAKHDVISARIERSYELVRRFLILASCTSLFIALGQVYGLHRGISRRLMRLVETARLMGTRQKLPPPLDGSDELAELDRIFRIADAQLTEYRNFKSRISNVVSRDLSDDLYRLLDDLETLKRAHAWDSERQQRLENAIFDTQRLRRLVSQLLAVESMDGGSFDMQIACTSTEFIVESALQSVAPLAENAEVKLERLIDHAMLEIDPDRITQVLINLLSNAIKFSPPESTVRCVCKVDDQGAEFIVSDSGTGIPEGFRERIFHKFESVGSSSSNPTGSGLGLHICKMIVEQHDGSIEYSSSPKGTTFVVRLPIKRSHAA